MSTHADRPAERVPGAPGPGAATGGFRADLATLPNILSLVRLIGLPIAAALYIYGHTTAGLILGVLASLTDLLDGYLARKLGLATQLGAILDRLGDLVLEMSAFVCLVHFRLMTPVVFFAYLVREMVVLSARQFVAERGGTIKTTFVGRAKTMCLALSFALMFVVHAGAIPHAEAGHALLQLSRLGVVLGLVFSYASGAQYVAAFARAYDQRRSRP